VLNDDDDDDEEPIDFMGHKGCKEPIVVHIVTHHLMHDDGVCENITAVPHTHTQNIQTSINTYFIAVKWGQSQNNDVIISSNCIYKTRTKRTCNIIFKP